MLIRSHDRMDDHRVARAFLRDQGFGHLVAGGVDRDVPVVVPTQYAVGGDEIVLHLARSNPIFDAFDARPRAVLSVAGDWAYIPGAWKAVGDEDPTLGIPTTYYAAVQVIGSVTVVDGAELAPILRHQLGDLEPDSGIADPTVHEAKFAGIRGVRLAIEELRAKFKYGGNVDDEHRLAVARRLAERAGPGDLAAAAHIPGVS